MSHRRNTRRLAMQILYQLDLRGQDDAPLIRAGMDSDHYGTTVCQEAFELAMGAWTRHASADALVIRLAPKWPTHRQPPVDRAILRLAYHEMMSAHAPVRVAINEAVELAKKYASEQSPAFINGVLDKISRCSEVEAVGQSEQKTGDGDGSE